MPVFRNRTVLQVARGVKGFLSLDVGLTRGSIPGSEQAPEQAQDRREKQKAAGRKRGFRAMPADIASRRREVASQYLTGSGIEVGGLHQPSEVPPDVTVRYVDRMTVEQLREQYPHLAKFKMVEVDIIDDGETLSSIAEDSVDFVIANGFIEHCQDPIAALENHLRVLKPNGILYLAVPDKRFTFDRDRPVTPLEHLIRDHREGPAVSVDSHFEEFTRLAAKVPEEEVHEHARQLAETNFSIHFHVWTQVEFLELLLYCRSSLRFPFEIELLQKNDFEFICILRKADAVPS